MKWSLLLIGLMSAQVWAHGPTPQKTDESIQVNAAADALWQRVSAPCGLAQWHPQVKACETVNDKQQKITLNNGKQLLQEIDEVSATDMTVSYRLSGDVDLDALPVSSLNGKIKVAAEGAHAKVTWTARYYRAFTGNEPPAGQDDEAAKNAVDRFVKDGLQGLKEGRINAATSSIGWRSKICVSLRPLLKSLGMSVCA
ncbi:SRPBCC family protein [Methylophilus medardicus]|uniref:SRPBCC family protein n=1 Tax=Methylophilus medardicus TaxID=2588534 RepID=A0A5B8CTT5_9PROT|nr:SRPBCC family protein [Methylophilus medardicus]QDC44659.1 SRPBCC family protein [Methylophilus medardicus]QDC49666.1 SRPBCC family protein [Methylophilus medardicus]QDC53371.1 SRPBCC family protein [Methylophilus medardicus]